MKTVEVQLSQKDKEIETMKQKYEEMEDKFQKILEKIEVARLK